MGISLSRGQTLIPVFYACDNNYMRYAIVSIKSLVEHASAGNHYNIHILCHDIDKRYTDILRSYESENVSIFFDDITDKAGEFIANLPLRDYYSNMTYYRLLIPTIFTQYDKAIYIDSDTIILDDVADMYNIDIDHDFVGAALDGVVNTYDNFGEYVQEVLDIIPSRYFNAGVLLMNLEQFREHRILERFIELAHTYTFVVAQDQDYLNVLCKDRVYYLDYAWNYGIAGDMNVSEWNIHIIHYNLGSKPWNYRDCKLGDYFWQYAERTDVYDEISAICDNYTEEEMKKDESHSANLYNLAAQEVEREDNYKNLVKNMDIDMGSRKAVVERIEQFEREGRFDEDVEDDPPSRMLYPDEIEYTKKPWMKRRKTQFAFRIARWFVNYLIREKKLIIKDFVGIENFRNLKSGAILTLNHFNAFDSFAADLTFDQSLMRVRGKKMYRIIREGNYTSFPGLYGFLMRNCNTLPLSSNKDTMRKLLTAVDEILQAGDYILVYPEQSMWWNYRKPKPLKKSAYKFAAKNNVPVLPMFVTMQDSDIIEQEDYYVQEYTIHIGEPIYPDKNLSVVENAQNMLAANYDWWKQVYEGSYGIKLEYTCGEVDCNGVVKK